MKHTLERKRVVSSLHGETTGRRTLPPVSGVRINVVWVKAIWLVHGVELVSDVIGLVRSPVRQMRTAGETTPRSQPCLGSHDFQSGG